MQTRFDVGQIVLLKVEVKSISLVENDIVYSVAIPNKKTPVKVSEKHIADVFKGGADGSKVRCTDKGSK